MRNNSSAKQETHDTNDTTSPKNAHPFANAYRQRCVDGAPQDVERTRTPRRAIDLRPRVEELGQRAHKRRRLQRVRRRLLSVERPLRVEPTCHKSLDALWRRRLLRRCCCDAAAITIIAITIIIVVVAIVVDATACRRNRRFWPGRRKLLFRIRRRRRIQTMLLLLLLRRRRRRRCFNATCLCCNNTPSTIAFRYRIVNFLIETRIHREAQLLFGSTMCVWKQFFDFLI